MRIFETVKHHAGYSLYLYLRKDKYQLCFRFMPRDWRLRTESYTYLKLYIHIGPLVFQFYNWRTNE